MKAHLLISRNAGYVPYDLVLFGLDLQFLGTRREPQVLAGEICRKPYPTIVFGVSRVTVYACQDSPLRRSLRQRHNAQCAYFTGSQMCANNVSLRKYRNL